MKPLQLNTIQTDFLPSSSRNYLKGDSDTVFKFIQITALAKKDKKCNAVKNK